MKAPATKTTIAVFKAVKKHGPISTPDLAKKMGKTPGTIDFYLRVLHSEPKQIYVAEIRDTDGRGRNARLWAVGIEPDVTRPKSKRNWLLKTQGFDAQRWQKTVCAAIRS